MTSPRYLLSTQTFASITLALGFANTGCPVREKPDPHRTVVVARVNGFALDEADVALEAKGTRRELDAETKKAVVETLIREELLRQKAVTEGLDHDPAYLAQVRELTAQLRSLERKELVRLLLKQELSTKAAVSDAEARAYFDQHVKDLRTEVHVFQILRRSKDEIAAAKARLDAGEPFEVVASTGMPELPAGATKPYDLGFLSMRSVPELWKPALALLELGGVTAVINGPSDRYWILKLVERRENSELTFEASREAILDQLRTEKSRGVREALELELRGKASVVYGAR
ncbi:MAG: peptidyl-prolyl cis-trans isomerase [Deltaproteobacteria bacterium]|nr:peptidyl-prolyl cis-trans isomerase [Deltaproteobacteria bacterium]